jgi:aquaporin Z
MSMSMKKLSAEFVGTAWLVLGGCGTAVLASSHVGWFGVACAFGLTVVTMAYAIGHVSGCHLNPAVTLGLWSAGRFPAKDVLGYVVAQVLGAVAAAGALLVVAKGLEGGYDPAVSGFAANGYGETLGSPKHASLAAALVTEVLMTFFFLVVILGATRKAAPAGFAGLAIGLALFLIHLVSIPVTNTSVNPARSTGPALFVGGWALEQLWLFWLAPIAGALAAGAVHKALEATPSDAAEPQPSERARPVATH